MSYRPVHTDIFYDVISVLGIVALSPSYQCGITALP